MEEFAIDDPVGEYEALRDPVQVMAEVLRLVAELRRAADRLGDAIVAAGVPARLWRTEEAWLPDLPGDLPEITLDTLLTRLAEFAADGGPHALREGAEGINHFTDEALVLYDAIRPLRAFAQRQRMLPPRDRGDHPLWRALGDARVGTPLDLVANRLRDLDALSQFIVPLTAAEWDVAEATPTPAAGPRPERAPDVAPTEQASARDGTNALAAEPAAPLATSPRPHRRLRDFALSRPVAAPSPDHHHLSSQLPVGALATLRAALLAHRWIVVGAVAVLLAMGTGLLTLATRGQEGPLPPPKLSYLRATPASITLACSGKAAATTLTLQDIGTMPEAWSLQPPRGVTLSALGGTLQPGASVTIRVAVAAPHPASGALTFADQDGALAVPFTITCGK